MFGLETIRGMNIDAAAIKLPRLKGEADRHLPGLAKVAMRGLDEWAAEADRVLVGRLVVRTTSVLKGRIAVITGVAIANGASGYHMLLSTRLNTRVGEKLAAHEKLAATQLLELDVTCDLLPEDDVPVRA